MLQQQQRGMAPIMDKTLMHTLANSGSIRDVRTRLDKVEWMLQDLLNAHSVKNRTSVEELQRLVMLEDKRFKELANLECFRARVNGARRIPSLQTMLTKLRKRMAERKKLIHPAFSACRWNRIRKVEMYLRRGFNVDNTDTHGNTLLHIAAQNGHVLILSCFCSAAECFILQHASAT